MGDSGRTGRTLKHATIQRLLVDGPKVPSQCSGVGRPFYNPSEPSPSLRQEKVTCKQEPTAATTLIPYPKLPMCGRIVAVGRG